VTTLFYEWELFTWKRIQPSLRGRTPEAISQPVRTDCFVISILAMTLVLQADSLSKVLFRRIVATGGNVIIAKRGRGGHQCPPEAFKEKRAGTVYRTPYAMNISANSLESDRK